MAERQRPGVQRLAAEGLQRASRGLRQACDPVRAGPAVERVAQERMAARAQMHADLVRAAAHEAAFNQAGAAAGQGLDDPVAGARRPAAAGQHGHLLAVARAASDVAFDLAGPGLRHAPDHGEVSAFDPARGELPDQPLVGALGLGGDHQAAGVLVQAVHDARPALAADAGQPRAAVGEERVDQGPVRVAGRRVDDQAGRLVEHDQLRVLVEDMQRHDLGLGPRRGGRGHGEDEGLARFDPV